MENMPEEHKKQIEIIQQSTEELKNQFFRLSEIIQDMDNEHPNPEMLRVIEKSLSRLVFSIEELGKKSSVLFANTNLHKDSTELSKFFYQIILKIESLKEALNGHDKRMFEKHLVTLKRTMKSAEYVLSLFIGEMTSEITESIFKPFVEQKQTIQTQEKIEKLYHYMEALNDRVERCEKKISKMIQTNPYAYLENDEATVLRQISEMHGQNLSWVEPRFIEQKIPISKKRLTEILEDLTHYGILQNKLRGGTIVYKYGDKDGVDKN